jgi:hypothetical protein
MDEAYYFEDGVLLDDILLDHLISQKNPNSSVILISDCCHSGSIWDLTDFQKDVPPRVISISAAQDAQTSKQIVVSKEVLNIVSKVEAGVFTSGLFDALKANQALTPLELKAKLDAQLRKYQQTVTLETTSAEMLKESLFLPGAIHATPEPEPAPAKPGTAPAKPEPVPVKPEPAPAKPEPAPVKPEEPAKPSSTLTSAASSTLASAGAATLAPAPKPAPALKPSVTPPPAKPSTLTPSKPSGAIVHKYQQPVVTLLKDGKKTELHRYFTKVRNDCTLDFHVISTTIEQTGKKPVVTHVVEIKKTDKDGHVTTQVKQFGNDLPWHAGKSKWSSEAVIAVPKPSGTSPATPTTSAAKKPTVAPPPPPKAGPTPTWGQSTSFTGESVNWDELPLYYLTPAEKEKLKASQAGLKLPSSSLKTAQDFMNATKKIYSKFATTNAVYGSWYRD